VVELPNHYPQADPTLLLYTLTGRRLVPGKLPVERGVLLLDAMAAAAVGRGEMGAVAVGVLDHDSRRAHYLEVARGMSLREAMSAAGISGEGKDIFGGDWRRGRRMTADSKMDGGELAIHLFGKRQHVEAAACTRCGWCLTVCPTLVSPALALEAAQRGDAEMALRAGTGACIECGLCDQACPSNLPLLEGIRKMKL
jgi:Na+-translocating ferredoxin:NAD+ oxidoreductase RnfC subunit